MPKLRTKKPTQQATTPTSFSKAREHRDHPADGPSLAFECDVCHHRSATEHGLRCHFENICFPSRRYSHPRLLAQSKMTTTDQSALLPFPFMELPPEVRLKVYEFIFVPRGPIRIREMEGIVDSKLS